MRALDGVLRASAELAEEGARAGGRAGETLHDDAVARVQPSFVSPVFCTTGC